VDKLDKEHRRLIAEIEQRLSELEGDLDRRLLRRVRGELPATIALLGQADRLPGHRRRQTRLSRLIERSKSTSVQESLVTTRSRGFSKRLRPRP
jgi:hypothetical protein